MGNPDVASPTVSYPPLGVPRTFATMDGIRTSFYCPHLVSHSSWLTYISSVSWLQAIAMGISRCRSFSEKMTSGLLINLINFPLSSSSSGNVWDLTFLERDPNINQLLELFFDDGSLLI